MPKKKAAGKVENQVYSNRVLRSEFARHWRTVVSGGYVIYIATTRAKVTVQLSNGTSKLLIFNKGGHSVSTTADSSIEDYYAVNFGKEALDYPQPLTIAID